MQSNTPSPEAKSTPRLRAMIEVIGAELFIYPVCDSDADEKLILDALRFVREDATG
jgi:hypothetical protein